MASVGGVARHTLIYGAGIALGKLAGFLMLPIYTRFLTPEDYGVLELLSMTVEVIGTLTAMGVGASVFKFHAQYEEEKDKKEVVSTAEAGLLALSLAAVIVGWFLSPYLTSVILGPDVPDLYFRLFFLIFFCNRLQMMPLLVLRVQEKSLTFALVNVAKLVLQLSLNIYFVVFRGMAVEGVLWGNLAAAALVGVGLQIAFLREIHVRPSWQKFVELLRYGAPLSIFFLGNFVLVFSDRYFLNFLVGAGAVGIYSLAYRFVSVLSSFAFAPFQLIWGPKRFEVAKSPERDSVFPRVFLHLNLVVGGTCLLISVFVDEVLRVMADPEFFSAHELVPVLLLAQVAFQWVNFSNLGLLLRDRTSTLAKISGVAVVVVVGLNYLLIPHWGAMGAAWATLGAYIFRYLAVLRYSQKADSIGHDWPRVLRVYAAVVIAVVFESSLPALPLLWSLAASSAVVVLAGVAIGHFVLGTEEKEKIMSSVRSLSKGRSPF